MLLCHGKTKRLLIKSFLAIDSWSHKKLISTMGEERNMISRKLNSGPLDELIFWSESMVIYAAGEARSMI